MNSGEVRNYPTVKIKVESFYGDHGGAQGQGFWGLLSAPISKPSTGDRSGLLY